MIHIKDRSEIYPLVKKEEQRRARGKELTKSWKCRMGIHRIPKCSGWLLARERDNDCRLHTVKLNRGNSLPCPIPVEYCLDCGVGRVRAVMVVPSGEAQNPFSAPPLTDCVCGKGDEWHRQQWQEGKNRILESLKDGKKRTKPDDSSLDWMLPERYRRNNGS